MKEQEMSEALLKIAEMAYMAANHNDIDLKNSDGEYKSKNSPDIQETGCTIKPLPPRLLKNAAEAATSINPVNAPGIGPLSQLGSSVTISDPQSLTILTSKYWGPQPRVLTVSFMEETSPELRARIVSHMNAWTKSVCISFKETSGVGHVRISRAPGGYWSYLGTDILLVPRNRPTMNLEGFSMNTSEDEFKRVIRHETGHTLGFPHEHMREELVARIDKEKAYAYFLRTQGWDRDTVNSQVLTSLDKTAIMGTPADQTSIMCYQLPGTITKNGEPIKGGIDINTTDFTFAGKIYPKKYHDPCTKQNLDNLQSDEWSNFEDVSIQEIEEALNLTVSNT